MGFYTKTVSEIVDKYSTPTDPIETKIGDAREHIFDFQYPIFDPTYKPTLETKILRKYYTREICEDNVDLWKFRLSTVLNEIMPFYNNLYKTELIEINPLYNVDTITKHKGKGSNVQTASKNGSVSVSGSVSGTTSESGTNSSSKNETASKSSSFSEGSNFGETTKDAGSESKLVSGQSNSSVDGLDETETNGRIQTNNTKKFSDTPQGQINGTANGYLTNVTVDSGVQENSGSDKKINKNVSKGVTSSNEKDTHTNVNQKGGQSNKDNESSESNSLNSSTSDSISNMGSSSEQSNSSTTTAELSGNNIATTDKYLEKVMGNSGISQSKLLMEYRETFINIDKNIIDELAECFCQLFPNADCYGGDWYGIE